jgi:arylsulfatase A-like enzyme
MDKEVGEILHELEKDQLLDSTFVIFVSDHGGPLPRQKREVIDAGLHVPMIVRFPKAKYAGTFDDRMFSFVDFAPSFLSLANIDIPDYIQGKAFWGKDTKKRKYIFGMRDRIDSKVDRVRSVHDGRFVYVKNYYPEKPWYQDIEYRFNMDMMQKMWEMHKNNQLNEVQELWFAQSKPKEQLFDLKNDPYEINNIADMDSNKARLDTFRKVLNEWLTNVGDMGTMTEYKMVKEMWPDFKQPITEKPVIEKRNDSIYISCPTEGASIVYQVTNDTVAPDTTEPNNWCLYDEPVKIKEGNHVHAVAIRIGYKQSYLNSYNYNEN